MSTTRVPKCSVPDCTSTRGRNSVRNPSGVHRSGRSTPHPAGSAPSRRHQVSVVDRAGTMPWVSRQSSEAPGFGDSGIGVCRCLSPLRTVGTCMRGRGHAPPRRVARPDTKVEDGPRRQGSGQSTAVHRVQRDLPTLRVRPLNPSGRRIRYRCQALGDPATTQAGIVRRACVSWGSALHRRMGTPTQADCDERQPRRHGIVWGCDPSDHPPRRATHVGSDPTALAELGRVLTPRQVRHPRHPQRSRRFCDRASNRTHQPRLSRDILM